MMLSGPRMAAVMMTVIQRPKIFFRYYLVDSSTGVKSQTMLAECKWIPGV